MNPHAIWDYGRGGWGNSYLGKIQRDLSYVIP